MKQPVATQPQDDAGSEIAESNDQEKVSNLEYPETEDIDSEIDFEPVQELREPHVNLAKGTHSYENLKVIREYRLSEDLEILVAEVRHKRDGETASHELFKYSTEDIDNIKQHLESRHMADPQVEFELFRELGGDQ